LVRILWGQDWIVVADYLPYFGLAILSQACISNTETLYKIYYKDLLLFKIGIFRSIAIVLFIIIGSLFSALMIARMVALVQIVMIIPVTVFYSFGKEMRINYKLLIWLYLPRIILFSGIFISVWKDIFVLTVIQLAVYFFYLLFVQRKELVRLKDFLMNKFISKRNG
jgi:hypothetical protein